MNLMKKERLYLIHKSYLKFKFLNSLFLGISIGSVFIIYSPLEPIYYSVGGILLAFFTMILASYYTKIINIEYFYKISLLVEIVPLLFIGIFLIFTYNYTVSFLIYIGYQFTFIFGSYLVRTETILIKKNKILTLLDISKQTGYIVGMAISYFFYLYLEQIFNITEKQIQVYKIHYLLLVVQILTIYFLHISFKKNEQ